MARVQGKRSKLPGAPPLRGAKSRSLKKMLDLLFAIIMILALPSKEFNTCITTKEGNNYTPIMTIVTEVLANLIFF